MSIIGVIQTGGSGNVATVVNNSDTQASARELKRELLRAQAEHWMALWGWTCALEEVDRLRVELARKSKP